MVRTYLSHLLLCCCRSSSRLPRSIQVDIQTLLGSEPFLHSTEDREYVINVF